MASSSSRRICAICRCTAASTAGTGRARSRSTGSPYLRTCASAASAARQLLGARLLRRGHDGSLRMKNR